MLKRQLGWLRRRRHERVKPKASCEVQVPTWQSHVADCLDVSPGGIRLRINEAVQIGDTLIFSIVPPNRPAIEIVAEVRHVTETWDGRYEIGMRWVAKSEEGERAFVAMMGGFSGPDLAA